MDQETISLNQITDILKRRKMVLIVTTITVFIIALAVAFLWPPVYQSSSTILIEEQEMPRDFVATTVTSYAEKRLQSITQQIMTTVRLLEVINRFNLYEDMRKKMTVEAAVEQMRKDIKFETIGATGRDPRSGAQGAITIAFTVSYEGRNPKIVQEVATVLSSLYLELNLSQREQQTAGVSNFLQDETKILKGKLTELDAKIADFKGRHLGALPDLMQINMQNLDRSERDAIQLKDQLRTLREKENYLMIQLASMPATETANSDKALLKDLRAKLIQLQSNYTDQHSRVIRTKQEIEELEERIKKTADEDPGKGKPDAFPVEQSDNQAYITLAMQLAAARSDIESVRRQIGEAEKSRNQYLRRIEESPKVDQAYKGLLVERFNVQAKFEEMNKKSLDARVSQGLEKGQMGERFTLIDPARHPEKPVRPNRLAIILIGFIFSIGAGVGVVALQEATDHSVRDGHALEAMTGVQVLGTIPAILTKNDVLRHMKRRRTIAVVTLAGMLVGLVLLILLWAPLMRRLP